jgi:hypothetical protein
MIMSPADIPVLLLTYKRVDSVISLLDILRSVGTKNIYFANNAPKNSNEKKITDEIRNLKGLIDWDCNVVEFFKCTHLDVKNSIVSSIDQFFEHVEFGIILEDDCIPSHDFFQYVTETYNQYHSNNSPIFISGDNFDEITTYRKSRLSRYCHIWGWASNRSLWKCYDKDLLRLTNISSVYKWFFSNKRFNLQERIYWYGILLNVKYNFIITWDYQLIFTMWEKNLYCILPNSNLVQNIGFNSDATNTNSSKSSHYTNELGKYVSIGLDKVEFDPLIDGFISTRHYQIKFLNSTYILFKSLIKVLLLLIFKYRF